MIIKSNLTPEQHRKMDEIKRRLDELDEELDETWCPITRLNIAGEMEELERWMKEIERG